MKLLTLLSRKKREFTLNALQKKGLQFEDDLSIMSMPDFGSEPYLIKIGKHVRICSNVRFITHDGSTWIFRDQERYKNVVRFGLIEIGDNCYIGDNVTIMPNVTIGENSIVGTGAIVTHSTPPGSVIAGVPAKVICTSHDFAEKCLRELPDYDVMDYFKNPRYWKRKIAEDRKRECWRTKE